MPSPENPARIFLSYARGDDEPFVARLHADLTAAGFTVWFDRVNMPSRALTFHQEIKDAIRARDRLVLVLGPKAAASDYVIEEWRFAWESEKPVVPILRLGDYTLVPDLLKFYHCEDFRAEEARGYEFHLEQLVRILSEPEPPLGRLIAVPSLPPHFLAQPERLRALKDAVLTDLHKPVVITGAASRVGVHGMGGIGKSVLACVLAHDRQVRQSFPDGVVWLPFGQQAQENIVQRQREAAIALGGDGFFDNASQGKAQLRELCLNKAALFVLDDVWDARHADAFDVLGPRCRALVTTRDAGLLRDLRATEYRVELLSDADALALLAKSSGADPATLPAEAQEVARECDHLPLALALCGGMAFGPDGIGWSAILEALRSADLEEISTDHPLARDHANLWRAITLSVQQLSAEEQRRFAELAVFPEDATVPEAAVRTLWSHTGGLKPIALEKLLKRLADRSLIYLDTDRSDAAQPVRRVSLHDLLHDYAKVLAARNDDTPVVGDADKSVRLTRLHQQLLDAYRALCPNGWPSGPDDGWFLQHLRDHFCTAGRIEEFAGLLLELCWLERKNEAGLTFDLANDFTATVNDLPLDHPQRQRLRLLDEALRRDLHFIARHARDYPQALFQCLWNSAWWYDSPEAAERYIVPEGGWKETPPWEGNAAALKLSVQLEHWRAQREAAHPRFPWLRALRPPYAHLGAGQLSVLRGHEGWVSSVAFSPDGRRMLSGSNDQTLRLWDADSGRELAVLRGHEEAVSSVAFSPDGRRVLSGSGDMTLRLWDAQSGEELAVLRGHESSVTSVAFSPDGRRMLSGSHDRTLRLWDAQSGEELAVLRGHEDLVLSVAFSPDGRRMLSGSNDQTLRLWDAQSGAELAVLRGHEWTVSSVVFSPDGRRVLSGSWDQTLRLWDAQSGEALAMLCGNEYPVTSVAFSPDGRRVLSGSWDNTLRLWDSDSGRELAVLRGHENEVSSVAFSPDGRRVLSGLDDKTARLWDAQSGREMAVLRGHEKGVLSLALSPDGRRVLSGSHDETVRLWDADSGRELAVLRGHEGGVTRVAFSPGGFRVVSRDSWGQTLVWDAESGQRLSAAEARDRERTPQPGALQRDLLSGEWHASTENGETLIRHRPGTEPLARFPEALNAMATHLSGRTLAGGSASHVVLLRLEGGEAEALKPES